VSKGIVQTGAMFLVLLVLVVSANYLLLAKQVYVSGMAGDMLIDNAYNAVVDVKRVIALDKNNVLSDSISDVVKGSTCAKLNDAILYGDKFWAYAGNTMESINETLAAKGLNAKRLRYTVDIDEFSDTETTCTVDISLDYTFMVFSQNGGLQKTEQFTAKKQLQFDDNAGYTVIDKTTPTDRTDYP
jgi:hypothetical protein